MHNNLQKMCGFFWNFHLKRSLFNTIESLVWTLLLMAIYDYVMDHNVFETDEKRERKRETRHYHFLWSISNTVESSFDIWKSISLKARWKWKSNLNFGYNGKFRAFFTNEFQAINCSARFGNKIAHSKMN